MSKPSFWLREAKSNEVIPNPSTESLVDQGDLPVNYQDLIDGVEVIQDRSFLQDDVVDMEDLVDSDPMLMEGSSFEPRSIHPYEVIRPKERTPTEQERQNYD